MQDHLQPQSALAVESRQSFAQWGLGEVAYIKLESVGGKRLFVIHAADGERLMAVDSFELAAATAVQNGLMPVHAQ
jgi:hypothetical protein